MKIAGLQKLSLLDFPEKLACTVFTHGCNFKCPFCHNAPLVLSAQNGAEISEEAFFSFLNSRKGLLEGVCVSGGEPTLQKDLEPFLSKIKEMGFAVKLDTNGYRPDVLKHLAEASLLDYVAMDIKNSKEKYAQTTDISDLHISEIEESVDFLLEGTVDFEFRTTIVKEYHTAEDLEKIGAWLGRKEGVKYYLQTFKDSGNLIRSGLHPHTEEQMLSLLRSARIHLPSACLRES